jgi:hypothetical protein
MGVHHLGYTEFEMARRLVLAGNFRRHLNAELQLNTFHEDLAAAASPERCWEILQHTYSEFGFNEIRFKFGDRLYTHTTNGHHTADTWTVRIRLSENDYLNLSREFDAEAPPIVSRFTDAIGRILRAKTSELLRTEPIRPAITISVKTMQPANGLGNSLAPITSLTAGTVGRE